MESHPSATVQIALSDVTLEGILTVPQGARGIVLFAHGSGSSRHSPRNRFVANHLNNVQLATLLIDLFAEEEELAKQRTAHLRFDLNLIADRLIAFTDWLCQEPRTTNLPLGYFGGSTGGGAVLDAAARRADVVAAVVSRGGRPNLIGAYLPAVRAATLLIVGSDDELVLQLNHAALEKLRTPIKELVVVPGASHLFAEPGKLDQVAALATNWFTRHLGLSNSPD